MKNVMTIALLLLATIGFAQAAPEQKATALTEKMQQEIKFNDDTKAKVKAINLDFVNKASALKSADGDRKERFVALKKLDDERAEALKKIFSETEYAAFEKFRQQNREQIKQRMREKRDQDN